MSSAHQQCMQRCNMRWMQQPGHRVCSTSVQIHMRWMQHRVTERAASAELCMEAPLLVECTHRHVLLEGDCAVEVSSSTSLGPRHNMPAGLRNVMTADVANARCSANMWVLMRWPKALLCDVSCVLR
jgi:hypothetical protein